MLAGSDGEGSAVPGEQVASLASDLARHLLACPPLAAAGKAAGQQAAPRRKGGKRKKAAAEAGNSGEVSPEGNSSCLASYDS